MKILSQGIFVVLLAIAVWQLSKSVKRIWGNIKLGKPFERSDNKNERLKQMLTRSIRSKKDVQETHTSLVTPVCLCWFFNRKY